MLGSLIWMSLNHRLWCVKTQGEVFLGVKRNDRNGGRVHRNTLPAPQVYYWENFEKYCPSVQNINLLSISG